jgi:hypothetical protein
MSGFFTVNCRLNADCGAFSRLRAGMGAISGRLAAPALHSVGKSSAEPQRHPGQNKE